jgi:ATP-dependent Clp endopeptidase proteolytic subunit ClpP
MSNYFTVKNFDSYGLESFISSFRRSYYDADISQINILIDSGGGEINIAYAMLDIMKKFNAKPISTATISKAYSCGAFLLGQGVKGLRYASNNASMMVHESIITANGQPQKCSTYTGYNGYLQDNNSLFLEIISESLGKQKNFLRRKLNTKSNSDWYMMAPEAKELGLIDNIDVPDWLLSSRY